jgi:hypothetical protein
VSEFLHLAASQEATIHHFSEYGVRTVHSLTLDEPYYMYYI